MAATIPAVSTEYLHGPVAASVPLDTQTVEVAILPKGQVAPDDTTVWTPAEWTGDVGTSRTWRLLIGPGTQLPLTPDTYTVWVRITDSPEIPVRKHDSLTIN